jgi:hypothetical protein
MPLKEFTYRAVGTIFIIGGCLLIGMALATGAAHADPTPSCTADYAHNGRHG